ncbi:MAG: hypothetical protein JW384_02555 [Nitrosomonadaceae bacterium]|nr:hypothetical protein [Nitrosomonadaceae bacterium]
MDLTSFLAAWGALCSSAAIGWNLYRDLNDRGKLKVNCYIGKIVSQDGLQDEQEYLVWNVINVGRRPIMVHTIGGENQKDHFLLPHCPLPRMLAPGEYLLEYTSDLSILGPQLKKLTVVDTTGKSYAAPHRQVRRLKRTFQNQLA